MENIEELLNMFNKKLLEVNEKIEVLEREAEEIKDLISSFEKVKDFLN